MRLASTDPAAAPLIDPRLLEHPDDIKPLIRALKIARAAFASEPFAEYEGTEVAPGPGVTTDEQFDKYIRETGYTVHHPVGTCRMGSDAGAVVDPQLRVNGIKGLRMADASVMPSIIGGNTNAPMRDDRRARAPTSCSARSRSPPPSCRPRAWRATSLQESPQKGCLMAREHMKSWQVGDVTVTRVVELWDFQDNIQMTMPDATAEEVIAMEWLHPHYATPDGRQRMNFQGFVVQAPGRVIVVDSLHRRRAPARLRRVLRLARRLPRGSRKPRHQPP